MPKPITIAVRTSACGSGSVWFASPGTLNGGAPAFSRPPKKINPFTAYDSNVKPRTTENVVGNIVIKEGLERVGNLIAEGQNVTAAFQEVGLFPPLVLRMLRVGENTGALDDALTNVSYFYNRDVRESIEKVQAMIEPVMTVIIGIILGWIMLAVLGPIYDTITKMKI